MAPTEGLSDLEKSVSKMVSKAFENAMEAKKVMGLQLSHLPNEDKGEESDTGEESTHSKETYSDVSKLITEMLTGVCF